MFPHQARVHHQQGGAKQCNTSSLLPALQTEDEQLARAIAASMGQEVPPGPSSSSQAGPGCPSSGSSSGALLEACLMRAGGQLGLPAPLDGRQVRRRVAAVPVDVQTALQGG